nr:LHFPL tetraspan subfamily member 6 protein isoform X1 [Globicephala melas]
MLRERFLKRMFLGGGSLSSPSAFSLAWLERRLPDGIPEPRVLCSRLSFPRPHWPCSPPYKVTTCQELLKAQKGHRAQSLRRSFPSPSPKGGRRPELKPQIPDPRKANRERVSSSKPLASTREDKQLSPLLLGLCLRHSRVGRSRGATKAGEGSGLEEPRQPPGGWEETPALGGRAPRPAPPRVPGGSPPWRAAHSPRPLRVPAGARGGDRRERRAGRRRGGGAACLACQRRIRPSARELQRPARGHSAPPEPPPESRGKRGCTGGGVARPPGALRLLPAPALPPASGPGAPRLLGTAAKREGRSCVPWMLRPGETASCECAPAPGEKVAAARQPWTIFLTAQDGKLMPSRTEDPFC